VQYLQYYDGLSWRGLAYHHYWLIVIIEAASYSESRDEKYIRFNRLKIKCNHAINGLTKGEIAGLGGGSFDSIIHSGRYKKFFTMKQVKVKSEKGTWVLETRIYPHITEIQEEIKSRQVENLDNDDERLARIDNKHDIIHRRRPILDEPSIQI
jgi:coproporphyrinogen III oxidase-like Fe-S oxidoreductase